MFWSMIKRVCHHGDGLSTVSRRERSQILESATGLKSFEGLNRVSIDLQPHRKTNEESVSQEEPVPEIE